MSRPVTDVRPLAVGAAWLTKDFECLAPADWSDTVVRARLFGAYEFHAAGWILAKTTMTPSNIPRDDGAKMWLVSKHLERKA